MIWSHKLFVGYILVS